MKKRLLIACTMQINLIQYLKKKQNDTLPIKWIPRNLHNQPLELNQTIQKYIDENQKYDEIALSFGLCGNAVIGLKSQKTTLVIPRYSDCISQLIAKQPGISENTALEKGCYYLTEEWTLDQEALVSQCEEIYKMYGKEEGQIIIDEIYRDYHTIAVIENESYHSEKTMAYAKKAAGYTKMDIKKVAGSIDLMEKLLSGTYDQSFLVLKPAQQVSWSMFL